MVRPTTQGEATGELRRSKHLEQLLEWRPTERALAGRLDGGHAAGAGHNVAARHAQHAPAHGSGRGRGDEAVVRQVSNS